MRRRHTPHPLHPIIKNSSSRSSACSFSFSSKKSTLTGINGSNGMEVVHNLLSNHRGGGPSQIATITNTATDAMNNNDCSFSVAQSTASLFSVGFKSHFEWLFTRESPTHHHHPLSEDDWNDKEERIRKTLAGINNDQDDTGMVDLWQLRELALSPGGLLTPFLRKQAWPKLLGCHDQVLMVASNSLPVANLVTPSSHDMRALKHDVSKTIWSVEEHLVASREQEKLHDEQMQQFLDYQKQQGRSTRVVRFAPHTRDNTCTSPTSLPSIARIDSNDSSQHHHPDDDLDEYGLENEHNDESYLKPCESVTDMTPSSPLIPKTIETAPVAEVVTATNPSTISGLRSGREGRGGEIEEDASLLSTESVGGYCPSDATHSTTFTLSSRVVRWRKATIAEQKILYNVILSILRTEAEPSDYFEDDRFHYFSGLQDLTALLMINVESPSLTSLILAKLAGTHLRDALRKDRIMIDTAIAHAFLPLLEAVDPELHRHLKRHGMTLPCFCRQWVSCLFAQDVPDVDVASRLLDAFLVSHPLLPLYASVALLTTARSQILQCDSHLSTLYSLLRGLPVQILFEEETRMNNAEDMISTALKFMMDVPPHTLIELIKTASNGSLVLGSIAIFQSPPDWCLMPDAPNDYALLKRAQELRLMGSADSKENESSDDFNPSTGRRRQVVPASYPLAFTAMGRSEPHPTTKRNRTSILTGLALVVGVAVLLLSMGEYVPTRFALAPTITTSRPSRNSKSHESHENTPLVTEHPILSLLLAPSPSHHEEITVAATNTSARITAVSPAASAQVLWVVALANVIEGALPTVTATAAGLARGRNMTEVIQSKPSTRPPWLLSVVELIHGAVSYTQI